MNNDLPNNCKIILQQNIPIEDLLGSVTTYNNVEGSDSKSLQLRTSARVFKKMKLDSANAASGSTSTTQEKKGIILLLMQYCLIYVDMYIYFQFQIPYQLKKKLNQNYKLLGRYAGHCGHKKIKIYFLKP